MSAATRELTTAAPPTAAPGGSASQDLSYAEVWTQIIAPKYTRHRQQYYAASLQHIDTAIQSMGLADGARVLDVGCGFGEASMRMAPLVGPSGTCTGIDICDAFLKVGREEAAKVQNLELICADAETFGETHAYDHAFSSFGTMFFERPVPALKNIIRCLRPKGRFTSLCWKRREDNPWVSLALPIVRRHLSSASQQGDTCGPGPFSLAKSETVLSMYRAAGFTDVELTQVDTIANLGTDPETTIDFQLAIGPAAERVRFAGAAGQEALPAIREDLKVALSRYTTDEGIHLATSAWRVTAHAPG